MYKPPFGSSVLFALRNGEVGVVAVVVVAVEGVVVAVGCEISARVGGGNLPVNFVLSSFRSNIGDSLLNYICMSC